MFWIASPEAPLTTVVQSAHIAGGSAWTPSAISANSEPFPGGASGAEPLCRRMGVGAEQVARQDAFEQADVGMRLTE